MPTYMIVSPSRNSDGRKAYSARGQLFDGRVDGVLVVGRSTQPFLDGAREMLARGYAARERLIMRHLDSGVDALISSIGYAASRTVAEGDSYPRFVPYQARPENSWAGSPRQDLGPSES